MNYTKKLLPIIISVALSGGIISCSKDKTPEEYLSSARTLLQEGKNSEAIINLKNLLKHDLENGEGRFLLGKSYALQGNWIAAEKELTRAKEYNFDTKLAYPLLAEVFSHVEDSVGIELLLKESVDDQRLELSLRYFLGVSYLSEGEKFRALGEFNEVVDIDSSSTYGQLSQAWIHGLSKQLDEAVILTDNLIDKNLNTAVARYTQANILFRSHEMEQASDQFNAYLQLRPQDHKNRLRYAVTLANILNLVDAEKQADLLFQLFPENALLHQIKAQAMFVKKDLSQAKEFAEKALSFNKGLIIPRIVAGVSAYELNQKEVAYTHLILIGDKLSFKHPVKRLLSSLQMELGYEKVSMDSLLNAPEDELDVDFLAFSAKKMFDVGNYQEANELMLKAKSIEPDNAELSYLQGIFTSPGSDELAESYFLESLKKNPNLEASTVMLAMKHLTNGKTVKSLNLAQSLEDKNPILSYILQGIIYKKSSDYKKSKFYFEQALLIDKNNVEAMSNLANIHGFEGKSELAIDLYIKTLKINNSHIPTIMNLLMLSTQAEHQEKIRIFFNKQAQDSDNSMMSRILVNYYIVNNTMDIALKYSNIALEKFPDDIELLLLEGSILSSIDRYEDAIKKYDRVMTLQKQNLNAFELKVNTLLLLNKLDEAIRVQSELVGLAPKELKFKLRLAQFYYDNKEAKKAYALLNGLSDNEKGSALFARLKGKFSFVEQDFQTAARYLEKAYKTYQSTVVLLELVQSLQHIGNNKRALLLIDDFEARTGKLQNITLMHKRAEVNAQTNPDAAIAQYEELLNTKSQKFIIYNNMAMIFLENGDLNQALEKINLAIELEPNIVQIQHSLGKILLKIGKVKEASVILEKVYLENNKDSKYILDYATSLYEADKKMEAYQLLDTIDTHSLTGELKKRFDDFQKKE